SNRKFQPKRKSTAGDSAANDEKAAVHSHSLVHSVLPSRISCSVNRGAHLLKGPTPTDVRNRAVNVRIGWLRLILQKGCCRHDHAGLAVATLRHVVLEPSLLDRVQDSILRQPFDGGDLLPFRLAHGQRARTDRNTVDVHGARSALRNTAAVFGAR